MPETSGELPSAEDVQASTTATTANTEQVRRNRVGLRIGIGALIFSIVSSTFVWVHSSRAIDTATERAQKAAIEEAARAREESDKGLCTLIGLLIAGDTPQRAPVLRQALREAYEAPHCRPALTPDGRYPSPLPSPSRS
jgi:hypothetical protein